MIITDQFVLINFPKTGRTFVRNAIKRIHRKHETPLCALLARAGLVRRKRMRELLLPEMNQCANLGTVSQHGTCRQIPDEHRQKTVVSVTRNPLDRYVSTYLFGWWKSHPAAPQDEIRGAFPNFPDLSFREYHEMLRLFATKDRLKGVSPPNELEVHTIQFIQFYFRQPDVVLAKIDFDYVKKGYQADMVPVVFLHQENLNQELRDFLLGQGYSERETQFLSKTKRINVTPREPGQSELSNFYTADLVHDIMVRDRLIFNIFPEYGQGLDG